MGLGKCSLCLRCANIGAGVQSQIPQTVDRAIMLAKVQQQVLDNGKMRVQKNQGTGKTHFSFTKQELKPQSNSSPLWKERQTLNYRKANNLCYHCGENLNQDMWQFALKDPSLR